MSSDMSVSLEKNKRIFKIIVIGDSSVGKTCLTYRFCGGKFPMKTEATIGVDFREKSVEVDNETIKLRFWDTAGQERLRTGMPPSYYRRVHLVIFVYAVTSIKSFDRINSFWLQEWMMYSPEDLKSKLILIGNKCDKESERQVSTARGRKYAKENDMIFFETSAAKEDMPHLAEIMQTLGKLAKEVDPIQRQPTTITLKIDEKPAISSCSCC